MNTTLKAAVLALTASTLLNLTVPAFAGGGGGEGFERKQTTTSIARNEIRKLNRYKLRHYKWINRVTVARQVTVFHGCNCQQCKTLRKIVLKKTSRGCR